MKKKNERKLVKTYYLPFGKVNNSFGKSLKYTWLIASEADILFFGTHWKTTNKNQRIFNSTPLNSTWTTPKSYDLPARQRLKYQSKANILFHRTQSTNAQFGQLTVLQKVLS